MKCLVNFSLFLRVNNEDRLSKSVCCTLGLLSVGTLLPYNGISRAATTLALSYLLPYFFQLACCYLL